MEGDRLKKWNIEKQLNDAFGKLPFNQNKTEIISHEIIQSEQKKYNISNDPNGVQGAIRLGIPFPNRHHPDFMKAQVLNTIFGGYFGSRLMSNIREDKGYTYGIHSHFQNHIQSSAWLISTEAGRDVCEATMKEIYKEMKLLKEDIVDDEELNLVRNYLIGSILGDLDGPFQVMNRWKNYILNGLTENFFYESIQTIKTVNAEELKALANKYFVEENFYELLVI